MSESEKNRLEILMEKLESGEIKGVSIDSRRIKKGELFVAIKGVRYDGHDFVADAIRKGAWGALVERQVFDASGEAYRGQKNILPVEDTLSALQKMSNLHRRKFSIPVIGITGSNGKTTTKEMLAGILRQEGPVLKNEGNLNNHIGVPLTLLTLERRHAFAVVEMGMSAPGEIETLAQLAWPDTAVITNVGPAHLEFFETTEQVAEAKGELLENLRPGGTAVLNADDPFFEQLAKKFGGRLVTFGIEKPADVRAGSLSPENGFMNFTLTTADSAVNVRLRAAGKHNVYNALAAAAAAVSSGMSLDAVKRGLEDFSPVAMRSEVRHIRGRTVLADCYNANPASMEAALATLVSLAAGNRAIAVLGDMFELGKASVEAHREIGRTVARLGVALLITVGERAGNTGAGAIDAGMPGDRVRAAQQNSEAARLLRELSLPGDVVLVKGSRGMKMETILEEF
jgi:UDP-N-acetylmuramoyl-tripeptide--D-alanyl-D-alanine ligase